MTSSVSIAETDVYSADRILTDAALDFVATLQRTFGSRRDELLAERPARHRQLTRAGAAGAEFLSETRAIREDPSWRVAPAPQALLDRRVEITGPTERKMTINALNSGAKIWLADMEDANTPHWHNVVAGQVNLYEAVRGTISHQAADGREYRLRDDVDRPTIVLRPRGWHLDERHIRVEGAPTVAALVDFGLYFFHNATAQLARGQGPYFYLPKLESHREARLWADVFAYAENWLGIPRGTVRATVLIETIPAALEMDEILHELRDYASGLNAGRWDYLFSLIKIFRSAGEEYVLPDRNSITMTTPFMRAYTELLVSTCHRRGAFAIGGMAAFIPSRRDAAANAETIEKVRADKRREATDGFDGSWVAHPDLVPLCEDEFTAVLGERPNQLTRTRDDVHVEPAELLTITRPENPFTAAGLRTNVTVALRYLQAWLGGNGAVAINNLMEDAATAEIARAQIWQWIHNRVVLDSGQLVTRELVDALLSEELRALQQDTTDTDTHDLDQAAGLLREVALAEDFDHFLTIPAYNTIR